MSHDRGRILIVEDDAEVREVWADVLKDKNYQINEARTTDDAIFAIRHHQYDLIVLDMSVPPAGREGGLVFLRAKSHNRLNQKTPVIIVSGIAPKEEIKMTLSHKFKLYKVFEKPIDNKELVQAIERALTN
ncbi:MAG: response regulator [Calditrichaeota bacterium]|nr:MAG: response regulator [Calditrichota bacterium]